MPCHIELRISKNKQNIAALNVTTLTYLISALKLNPLLLFGALILSFPTMHFYEYLDPFKPFTYFIANFFCLIKDRMAGFALWRSQAEFVMSLQGMHFLHGLTLCYAHAKKIPFDSGWVSTI